MRIIGKEDLLEPLNKNAIRLAKEVAKEHPTEEALVAGNISNTNIFDPEDPESKESVRNMFAEMVSWCKDEGVDFVNGETFYYQDRKSTRLNSSHVAISYAVFCLKKKKINII